MWKEYSFGYIRKNRASSLSIMAGAFIAALFLALICSLFYNFWLDSIEGAKQETGDWHARITGVLDEEDLAKINRFANVEQAVICEELSGEDTTVVDLRFYNKRTIYRDMSALIRLLGLPEGAADYNYELLSLYFIRIPGDEKPRLLLSAYLAVAALVCVSLILVIHNSFAVSMHGRVRQFGIFSSIGAAPRQILLCLLQEALMLSILPILIGILLGMTLSFCILKAMLAFVANVAGGRQTPFGWHPLILVVIFLLSIFTVLISAWIPARKLSRITPLEAIRGTRDLQPKRKKGILPKRRSRIRGSFFGIEGELAQNALRAQKKALRTTSLSLTLAFLGFMLMQCFFTLSGISTNHTYFEAYQDVWDVMVTVPDTGIGEFASMREVQNVQGVSSIVYQKAEALCILPQEAISPELTALGGLEAVAGSAVSAAEQSFLVKAPIVIMDDKSFLEYCGQIGIEPELAGSVLYNRIWDSINSNFRYKNYIPYVTEEADSIVLQSAQWEDRRTEVPVLAYTQDCPVLREEYDAYALVNFMPLSLWNSIAGQIGGTKEDTYIRILAEEDLTLSELNALEEQILQTIAMDDTVESENRLQEKITNDAMIRGYKLLLGGFCTLFAVIGIAHVFSHTLGFLRQRQQEFARYLSVGLTPGGMRKIFCLEALAVAGRPALAALCLTAAAMAVMIKTSYLAPMEFILKAPVLPIFVFLLAVFGFVALAYYLGAKRILRCNLAESLRDELL